MSKPTHCFLCILACVLAPLMPGQAQAQAFSFNVPLDVKDIHPKYTYVKVTCKVIAANGVDEVGRHSSFVPLQSHAFNGTVSVPVDPAAGKNALDGTRYYCDAHYCTAAEDASCVNAARMDIPENKVQPGAAFSPGVHGDIP